MRLVSYPVIAKICGTLALAGGFLLLLTHVPFVPDVDQQADVEAPGTVLATPDVARRGGGLGAGLPLGFEPPIGLFKANFAPSADAPGFATEEHSVPGVCEGAGKRWSLQTCPTCTPLSAETQEGFPALLLWTETIDGRERTSAVTADCTAIGADGLPVVTSITFDDPLNPTGIVEPTAGALLVPLLPGATRRASLEVGEWLATFDLVARPGTALGDMVALLEARGWRDIPAGVRFDAQQFVGDRVLTNDANATCVLSLTEQNGDHQLLTIISPGRRG
jgi:hypothetical protein